MALSALTVFEVRTTGVDTNGGGFVTGAAGSDYSQQDAAQYSGTDLAIDATTNTKVTSATHNFVAADVGNLIQITAGASWTTGFYQIVSVASNAATLDRSPGATSLTGGTFAVGGALLTISKAAAGVAAGTAGNTVYIKAGTYSEQVDIISTSPAGTETAPLKFIGYNATRTDNPTGSNRPIIEGGNTRTYCLTNAGRAGYFFYNLVLQGATNSDFNATTSPLNTGGLVNVRFTKGSASTNRAVRSSDSQAIAIFFVLCEFDSFTPGSALVVGNCTTARFHSCLFRGNTTTGSNNITSGANFSTISFTPLRVSRKHCNRWNGYVQLRQWRLEHHRLYF
jgi:hypothetical protein